MAVMVPLVARRFQHRGRVWKPQGTGVNTTFHHPVLLHGGQPSGLCHPQHVFWQWGGVPEAPLTFLSVCSPLLSCPAAPRLISSSDLSPSSRHLPPCLLDISLVTNRGPHVDKPQTPGLPPDHLSLSEMLAPFS